MCGIAGWFGQPPQHPQELAAAVQEVLRHRGPDDGGFDSGPGWGLIFRRLSILDVSPLGHQPMSSPDGRYWLVFNGEIYNYVELRRQLERQQHVFSGTSDTEVLLHLLIDQGADALGRLNGMFSFAFVDTHERTFLMARDRLGQKPLYFFRSHGHLRFASELKALLAWPDAARLLDPLAVVQYLGLSYLPAETCILDGYEKLPAAHYLVGSIDDPQSAQTFRYWDLTIESAAGSPALTEDQESELVDLLTDATRIRLRSDVPVGLFLSGGIDSGLVAWMVGRLGDVDRLLALTVGFEDERFDESELATLVAEHTGLPHQVVAMKASSLSQIDQLAATFDEPFADPSALPTMNLCAAAAGHATVFLAGDGGDEAFAGYQRYIDTTRYGRLLALPRPAAQAMRALARLLPVESVRRYQIDKATLPDSGMAAAFDQLPEDPILGSVLSADYGRHAADAGRPLWSRWASIPGDGAVVARQQALDYALYLPDDILVKVDRASMAHSIEVRSPFLDYRVVEYAARLPRSALLDAQQGKLPLRRMARRTLPAQVSAARKRGFGVPLDDWFRADEGQELVRHRLLGDDSPLDGVVNKAGIATMLDAQASVGGRGWGTWLWRLSMLDAWARRYLMPV